MLLGDNPPSTMQLIARSLIHMVERGASRYIEKKEREGLVEDTWKVCQTEYLNRSQKHECGNWAAQFLFWAYIL